MSQLPLDTQVCDIVTALPQSADMFRNLHINFCCGGKIALKDAAEELKLNPEEVLNSVKAIEENNEKQDGMDPTSFGSKTLVDYIQEKYHDGLRDEFPLLAPYITKIVRVHGENHPHLLRVQEIFQELRSELLDHTADEDDNVFPLILEFLASPTSELKEKVKPHVLELGEEHENAGKLLFEVRELHFDLLKSTPKKTTYFMSRRFFNMNDSAGIKTEILVATASSMTPVFTEIATEFEKTNKDIQIIFTFGSFGKLAQQIKGGAPRRCFHFREQF